MSNSMLLQPIAKKRNLHDKDSMKKKTSCIDDLPLISLDGYAINSVETAFRMKNAQESLKRAREKIIRCK